MISYSQRDMQRQLVSDRRLWKRLPGAAAAVLWPIEAILLGWGTARWAGLITVAIVVVLSSVVPPRLSINLYLLDLLEQSLRLPLWLGWLLLIWQLSAQEPIFPVLGAPAVGAVFATALTWLLTQAVILVVGFTARRTLARGGMPGA